MISYEEIRHREPLAGTRNDGQAATEAASRSDCTTDGLPPLLTVKECANYLDLSINTVRSLCRSGEIPARHIGRSWRIPRGLLLDFLGYQGSEA